MAVEILVDTDADQLTMNAVHSSSDISREEVRRLADRFNEVLMSWGTGSVTSNPTPALLRQKLESVEIPLSPPATGQAQASIVNAAKTILGISEIDFKPNTSLIALGMDSIKAVTLSKLLRAEGLQISASDIMRRSTIQAIATHVKKASDTVGDDPQQTYDGNVPLLSSDLDWQNVGLSPRLYPDDLTRVFPATTMQCGFLAQVFKYNHD